MNKLIGWIFLIIGILMLLPLIKVSVGMIGDWLVVLGYLVIGIVWLTGK